MNTLQKNTLKSTILVVDDSAIDLELSTDILTLQGYIVRTTSDGAMAVSLAQTISPDLILLDIMMGEISGYDVCRQLKEKEQTRDIPVIFVSGMQEELDTGKVFAVGGVDYVSKPYRAKELLARVESHLALRRRNYELELLNRVGRELTETLNLQHIAEQIQEAVTEVMNAMGTSVWLLDQDNEAWLECRVAFMQGLDQVSSDLRVRSGQGVVGWVMEQGQSVLVNNPADDPRFFAGIDEETGFITRSLLAVPLRARDRVIGVLEVVNKRSGGFSPNDLILIETIAASAAIAIDNTWLFEALSQHAMDLENTNAQLQQAVDKVKLLTGLLPICSHCKKIRNDHGYWEQVEIYIAEHSLAEFSHGMCPECVQAHYPELYEKLQARRQAIVDFLGRGRATLAQIAAAVNLPKSNTENRLQDMHEEGLIKQVVELDGQIFYQLPPKQS